MHSVYLSLLVDCINNETCSVLFLCRGYLRQMKPFFKHVDTILDRIFAGNKFAVNATNILLMGILIVLICLLLEGAEKPPKRVVVVDNKKNTAVPTKH